MDNSSEADSGFEESESCISSVINSQISQNAVIDHGQEGGGDVANMDDFEGEELLDSEPHSESEPEL